MRKNRSLECEPLVICERDRSILTLAAVRRQCNDRERDGSGFFRVGAGAFRARSVAVIGSQW